jgi:heme peroxidase
MPKRGRIHGQTPRARAQQRVFRLNEGRFGYLFPDISPAPAYPPERLRAAAEAMKEEHGTDNDAIPAGYTYFGQFVDHDVTFDATSRLGIASDPDALITFRSPRFDLDSLYGSGPVDEPFQYDADDFGRLLVAQTPSRELDLPRNDQHTALIGDPRNDENVIVSQLQVAFLRFHNRVLDDVLAGGAAPGDGAFDEARRIVRWHYQWVVVHDFLPRICGAELVAELAEQPVRLRFMPVEFSAGAYRFGHSMVRAGYALNAEIRAPLFVAGDEVDDQDDLRGHKVLPPGWTVDWSFFLPLGDRTPTPSRLIDGKLAAPLFDLPRLPAGEIQSLAHRNLQRGQDLGLPSGQDVARRIDAQARTGAELGTDLEPTPLWLYVLLESGLGGGQQLGPVGARIVAETLLGLLSQDPSSYVRQERTWQPTITGGAAPDGTFGLPDLIRYATGG